MYWASSSTPVWSCHVIFGPLKYPFPQNDYLREINYPPRNMGSLFQRGHVYHGSGHEGVRRRKRHFGPSHRVCVAPQLPTKLIKGQEESHEKRAATLAVDTGKVFLKRKGRLVKVVIAADDQHWISESCHSDPTSGHFGTTKTWRRIAERFYWQGISNQVKELVSNVY